MAEQSCTNVVITDSQNLDEIAHEVEHKIAYILLRAFARVICCI